MYLHASVSADAEVQGEVLEIKNSSLGTLPLPSSTPSCSQSPEQERGEHRPKRDAVSASGNLLPLETLASCLEVHEKL